jgi:hypothetical protein
VLIAEVYQVGGGCAKLSLHHVNLAGSNSPPLDH